MCRVCVWCRVAQTAVVMSERVRATAERQKRTVVVRSTLSRTDEQANSTHHSTTHTFSHARQMFESYFSCFFHFFPIQNVDDGYICGGNQRDPRNKCSGSLASIVDCYQIVLFYESDAPFLKMYFFVHRTIGRCEPWIEWSIICIVYEYVKTRASKLGRSRPMTSTER